MSWDKYRQSLFRLELESPTDTDTDYRLIFKVRDESQVIAHGTSPELAIQRARNELKVRIESIEAAVAVLEFMLERRNAFHPSEEMNT